MELLLKEFEFRFLDVIMDDQLKEIPYSTCKIIGVQHYLDYEQ